MSDLPKEVTDSYTYMRTLPDGRICGVHRLMFHWTVHIDIDEYFINDRYCFETEDMARESLDRWDGYGDMPGDWHKHPKSGRRRDPVTGKQWHEDDPQERSN